MAKLYRDGNRWVIFTSRTGKWKRVPRSLYRHLDNEPRHNAEAWMAAWEALNEKTKPQWEELTDGPTIGLVERFCVYLETRKKSPKTIRQHRHNLCRYACPYFVQKEGLETPSHWPTRSVRLLEHLREEGVGDRTIATVNVSLRVFWNWLVEEGHAAGTLLLRNPVKEGQTTPLNFAIKPSALLKSGLMGDLRLLSLIGFFFSLRPQELVALRPRDFLAGARATELECCAAMTKAGLYGKFAVNIHRQRVGQEFKTPKAGSRGWVACFDEAAARAIVAELAKRDPEELLFGFRLDHWYRVWRKSGYPGLSLKDLRRASIYWLGNFTDLPFAALKNHARHSDPSTTALYVRRPEDKTEDWGLDLDA